MRPLNRIARCPARRAGALLLVACAVALALVSCGRKPGADAGGAAGNWESTDSGNTGVGNNIDLVAGGAATYTISAMAQGRYRVAGDTIIVTVGDSASGGPVIRATPFRLAGDTLTMVSPTGTQEQKLSRFGEGSGLAGAWGYRHPAGATAYEIYADDGIFRFRMPMRTLTGTWAVERDTLQLALEGEKPQRTAFRRDGPALVMVDANGREARYLPVDPALPVQTRRAPERPAPTAPPPAAPAPAPEAP